MAHLDDEIPEIDFREMFRVLERHGVEYVVVGGIAANTWGSSRVTHDLDVVPNPQSDNLVRLVNVLEDLDAKLMATWRPGESKRMRIGDQLAGVENRDILAEDVNCVFLTRCGQLDIGKHLQACPPYEELASAALTVKLGDIQIAVAGRDHLIEMKRSVSRRQDLEDIAAIADRPRPTGTLGEIQETERKRQVARKRDQGRGR